MMEEEVEFIREVKLSERRESVGKAHDPIMLWRKPNECPTSWQATNRTASRINASGNWALRANGSMVPVWTVIHSRTIESTLCHHIISASRISPERGASNEGPMAFFFSEAAYVNTE